MPRLQNAWFRTGSNPCAQPHTAQALAPAMQTTRAKERHSTTMRVCWHAHVTPCIHSHRSCLCADLATPFFGPHPDLLILLCHMETVPAVMPVARARQPTRPQQSGSIRQRCAPTPCGRGRQGQQCSGVGGRRSWRQPQHSSSSQQLGPFSCCWVSQSSDGQSLQQQPQPSCSMVPTAA